MLSARTVSVQLTGHKYDILVQPGLYADAGAHLGKLTASKNCILISEHNIPPQDALHESLENAGFNVSLASIPGGEENKSIEGATRLYESLLGGGHLERSTPILALGGGVIGDVVGFVAATILRGVPLVQIPTTLLAMVDASVGGKTGVNHPVGKNLIGAFYQPIAVLIDPTVLKTLPVRELRSGLAECIKHDIIRDANHFVDLEMKISRALNLDMDYLTDLIAHNVAIKARVVESDPFEKGERAHLNFGHTFGHAIENVSQYAYAHGECVALGMVAASRLAASLKMLDQSSVDRIVALIKNAGLPTSGLKLPIDEVAKAMLHDKKVKARKIRFILPDRIGHVIIRDDIPENLVRQALESLQGGA
jgi:3-dehydroquinate synthase